MERKGNKEGVAISVWDSYSEMVCASNTLQYPLVCDNTRGWGLLPESRDTAKHMQCIGHLYNKDLFSPAAKDENSLS